MIQFVGFIIEKNAHCAICEEFYMKRIGKTTMATIFTVVLAAIMILCAATAAADAPVRYGNTDLNILNGGVMLTDGDDFYYTDGGIWLLTGESESRLSADEGRNLNLADGWVYYTLDNMVYRVPATGGAREHIYTHDGDIRQLYVENGSALLFLSEGAAFRVELSDGACEPLSAPANALSMIPTDAGILYLAGEVRNYDLYAGETLLLAGVTSGYTDSGYLIIARGGDDWQISLPELFNGFAESELAPFDLHGTVDMDAILEEEDALIDSNDAGISLLDAASGGKPPAETVEEMRAAGLTEGQINIVLRARQLMEVQWTPLVDRYQWGYRGVFKAENTYTGIPYGQPVNTGYIGYKVTVAEFLAAVNDNTSKFYSGYSTYNKIAPYYSADCSGFVSYAWGLTNRKTTSSLPNVAEKVSEQSIYALQVGDAMDATSSHVVLVAAVRYDADGNLSSVDIREQTPVITKYTRYGEGGTESLARLQSYYLGRGYVIYRNPERDSVTYTHSCAVPLDGDYCENCRAAAPKSTTTRVPGGRTVALSHTDPTAVIYYTTDGSDPLTNGTVYTTPLTFTDTTLLRAAAVTAQFSAGFELKYTVTIPQADTPAITAKSGQYVNGLASQGATLSLTSSEGATIYYTTDGSQPTTSSKVYSSPIPVSGAMTIRAIAMGDGYRLSNELNQSIRIGQLYTITASAGNGGSISPAGSTSLLETTSQSYTIKASSGYAISDVLVDGKSVGAVSSYTFSNVTGNHTIQAKFRLTSGLPFTDVKSSDWYYDAVCSAYARSLFNGTSETTFSPATSMTRGMFVTVLGRLAGVSNSLDSGIGVTTGTYVNVRSGSSTSTQIVTVCEDKYTAVQILGLENGWYKIAYNGKEGYIRSDLLKVYSGKVTDLKENQYYSAFVEWASLMGITSATQFRADDLITREDMCVMLYNYCSVTGITLPQTVAKAAFTDDSSISSYAKTAVYALQQAGVINGVGSNTFDPKGTAQRSHVAQIYMKFLSATE